MPDTKRTTSPGLRVRRDLWVRWCRLAELASRTQRSEEWSQKVVEALGDGTESLDYRLAAMAKGYALMRAAYLDFTPALGRNAVGQEPSKLDAVRGVQWRLVMCVAGFEMFLRGRLGREEKIWKLVEAALPLVSLEPPPPMARPRVPPKGASTKLEGWLDIPPLTKKSRIAEFLGLNKFEEILLLEWLRGTNEPAGWKGHAHLATALRNVTAHGALSARKVRELRLRHAIETLPRSLFRLCVRNLGGTRSYPGRFRPRAFAPRITAIRCPWVTKEGAMTGAAQPGLAADGPPGRAPGCARRPAAEAQGVRRGGRGRTRRDPGASRSARRSSWAYSGPGP
jgi:hypothetical protein